VLRLLLPVIFQKNGWRNYFQAVKSGWEMLQIAGDEHFDFSGYSHFQKSLIMWIREAPR